MSFCVYNIYQICTRDIIKAYKGIDVSVNCSCVTTRWQQYSTHLHTNSTQNNTNNNFGHNLQLWLEGFLAFEPRVVKLKINDELTAKIILA